jgi:hypothetical protein
MSEIEEMFPDFGKWVARPAMFLGVVLIGLYLLSYYYHDAWVALFLLGALILLGVAIAAICIPLGKYIRDAKANGTITERDEFWACVILLAVYLMRR